MPGEGSVFRRKDGRWVATISRGRRGERTITTVYRQTKAEAIAALDQLRRSNARLDRTSTVGAYLEQWLRDADVRPNTRKGYNAVIGTHLDPTIGHIRLADLRPLDVRVMMAGLAGAPKTRRNVLVMLRRALREAVRAELVDRNVASPEYIDAPKVASREPDTLTLAEVAAIRAVLPGDPIEPHVRVALGTGLRQGEQLGLEWQDVDGDVLHIRRSLTRVNGEYVTTRPKTDRSIRDVPISPDVQSAFDLQRRRIVEDKLVPIATGPVFVNGQGADMNGSVLTHRWYMLQERAGVRRRAWKVLRATFSSQLYAAGIDDLTIAALMGHARTHTTKRHYIAGAVDTAAVLDALTRTAIGTEPVESLGVATAGRG